MTDLRVSYAKFNTGTLKVTGVGICQRSWIKEQETALDQVAVEISLAGEGRTYVPKELYVDPETFVVRRKSDNAQVSVD